MELTALYSDRIIEIAGNLPLLDRLGNPDATAKKTSRVCGSVVEVDVTLRDGRVAEYAHDISACALGQTSASIVAAHILGATVEELRDLRDQMVAMLKNDGPPPTGKWDDLKYLEPVKAYPARHMSTLLVFEAVIACLDQIEAGNAS